MATVDIFQSTSRPAPELLYRRDGANDRRLGEVVQMTADAYAKASLVILGCPSDYCPTVSLSHCPTALP